MEESYLLLQDIMHHLSYKPGYSFALRRPDSEMVTVALTCSTLDDSSEPDKLVGLTISNTFKLSTIVTRADAMQAFASVIARFELHEAAEFFQYDGRSVFLPHARGDSFGDFSWPDFSNLGGRYLRAMDVFIAGSEQ